MEEEEGMPGVRTSHATKVLVTGGAGCIGSEVTGALLERGTEVTVLDNFTSGRHEHIAPFRDNARFLLVEGDILTEQR